MGQALFAQLTHPEWRYSKRADQTAWQIGNKTTLGLFAWMQQRPEYLSQWSDSVQVSHGLYFFSPHTCSFCHLRPSVMLILAQSSAMYHGRHWHLLRSSIVAVEMGIYLSIFWRCECTIAHQNLLYLYDCIDYQRAGSSYRISRKLSPSL